MRITKYHVELDQESRHNILVKDSGTNYATEERLDNPGKIAQMLNTVYGLNRQAEEYMYLICFDAKMKPIAVFEVSHGAATWCICNSREIYVRALLCGAVNISLCHNHPSGVLTPSQDDMESFNRVKEAGKLLDIPLVDFIIVGDGNYYSFLEHGIG